MSNNTERYTLDEAAAELRRRECQAQGHDWTFVPLRLSDEAPRYVRCDRCGWSGSVTMDARFEVTQ